MRRIPVDTSKIRFISTASPRAGPSTRSCPMAAAAACPTSRTPTTRAARARPRDVPLPSLQPPADPQRSVRVFVVAAAVAQRRAPRGQTQQYVANPANRSQRWCSCGALVRDGQLRLGDLRQTGRLNCR